jgi:hypothetical protein
MAHRLHAAHAIVVTTLLVTACASTPSADLPAYVETRAVSPDRALLVIYRDSRYYASRTLMPVSCDGAPVARLPNGAALQYLVLPGVRTVTATLVGAQALVRDGRLVLETQVGKRYFIQVIPSMGLTTVDVTVALVPPERATEVLKRGKAIVGPGGEQVLVETKAPQRQAAAPVQAGAPSAGQGAPAGVAHTGEEATGNVPRKLGQLLLAGTQVSVVVIMPEKSVTYHGPAFEMPMVSWQKKMAAEIVNSSTATMLATFGEAPGFSVVNRESVMDILGEFELQGSEAFDQQTTARIGRMVGANHMLLLSFSREHISGNRYRDIRSVRLIDMQRNTILALDELADDLAVDTSTQTATVIESRLNGRRYVADPETHRVYFAE